MGASNTGRREEQTEEAASRCRLWLAAVRPFSFPCSLVPVFIATAASAPLARWRWDVLGACIVAVLAMHVAGNLLNDYFDFTSGVDAVDEEADARRPGRLLVRGVMKPGEYARGALLALALALLAAAYLAWRAGLPVLGFYAFGVVGLYAYTGPPFRWKARSLGEVVMVVWFGPALVAGVAYAQTGAVPLPLTVMGVPIGFLTAAILVSNNLRDLRQDAAGGVTTLAHRIGARAARWLYLCLVVGGPSGIALVGLWQGVPLLSLTMLSLLAVVGPVRAVTSGRRLADIDARTARLPIAAGIIATATLIYCGGL